MAEAADLRGYAQLEFIDLGLASALLAESTHSAS